MVVLGHEKGRDTQTRLKHNFGMARPEGYRKAVRLMDMAEQFDLPVLTFVDTAGANKVLILEHSIYSVISPEAGSSILFRDRAQAAHMAKSMRITAQDLIGLKIVDRIIPEPTGGAHADPAAAIAAVGDAVEDELRRLIALTPEALRQQGADRFYTIGRTFG